LTDLLKLRKKQGIVLLNDSVGGAISLFKFDIRCRMPTGYSVIHACSRTSSTPRART